LAVIYVSQAILRTDIPRTSPPIFFFQREKKDSINFFDGDG